MITYLITGKVIGKKGNTIQGIMEKSRVLNVKIMGDDEAKKKNVDTKDKVSHSFIHVYINTFYSNTNVTFLFTQGTICVHGS